MNRGKLAMDCPQRGQAAPEQERQRRARQGERGEQRQTRPVAQRRHPDHQRLEQTAAGMGA
ncbi:MAG: hypothetical protein RMK84_19610 [Oscillochloridaceae bacterium]|nr:hypothetical protein [Oscillochloridaceae bacterium]